MATSEDGFLTEEFTFQYCEKHWGTIRLTRKCLEQKPLEIENFLAGHLPPVEKCQLWKFENSANRGFFTYTSQAGVEKMEAQFKSGDIILNLIQTETSQDNEYSVASKVRFSNGSDSSETDFVAQEKSEIGLTKRYYINSNAVAPISFYQSYESNFNSQFNVILNAGLVNLPIPR
jgi:hypothetical protein